MLSYKLLSVVTASDVSNVLVICRDTNALLKDKNLYISKLELLNARPVRGILFSTQMH